MFQSQSGWLREWLGKLSAAGGIEASATTIHSGERIGPGQELGARTKARDATATGDGVE